ncbi:ribosomal protein L16, partial [Escherichia coli]|nr:ribosomal protein L16 [Escherichia coli]
TGVNEETAREAMRLAAHKLPVKTKFVKKSDFEEVGGEINEG